MADVGAVLRVLDGYLVPILVAGVGMSAVSLLVWAWRMGRR
jgi:hypothetical protein